MTSETHQSNLFRVIYAGAVNKIIFSSLMHMQSVYINQVFTEENPL